ncbi:MAG TPA: PAS domain S-box protein [Spirochaetota bacterium]|nr:PAS domain S-box protein [Spirochaetota bacterium]
MAKSSKTSLQNGDIFRLVVEKARDVIVVIQDGIIRFVNPAIGDLAGYGVDECLKRPFIEFVHPEDRDKDYDGIPEGTADNASSRQYSFRLIAKNGSILHVEAHIVDIEWEGHPATSSFIRDITERHRMESTLVESERRFRLFAKNLPEVVFETDPNGILTYVNERAYRLFGYSEDDFKKGFNILSAVVVWEHPQLIANIQKIINGLKSEASEYTLVCRDGRTFPALVHSNRKMKDGIFAGLRGIIIDISQRKEAEQRLAEREKLHRLITDTVRDAIRILDLATMRYIYANPYAIELFGSPEDDYVGSAFGVHLDDESREGLLKMIEEELLNDARRDPARTVTFELVETLSSSDKTIWTENRATFVRDSTGRPSAILTITRDITARKEAEIALRESEELFRMMTEEGSDLILILEKSGTIIYQSPSVERILGYGTEGMIGKDVSEFIHPGDLRKFVAAYSEFLRNPSGIPSVEMRVKHRDASWRTLEIKAKEITRHHTLKGLIVNCRDITDRRRIEEELHRAQKLESLGLLAGGIAHDFNNILTSIIGNIALSKMDIDAESEIFESLSDAEKASYRAKDLTLQLLTFSRGGAPIKKTTSLIELIRETVTFTLRGAAVQYDLSIADDLWLVDVDEGQISQVINNLLINALQAMGGDGKIEITAQNRVIGPIEKRRYPFSTGCYVVIAIRDYGPGIPEELLQKIFDPYFTTKKDGSGLGLSTVYSIIKNHSGYVDVGSQLGRGATFTLFFPASVGKSCEIESVPVVSGLGQRKILLMDDDTQVLRVTEKLLSRLGYRVHCSRDGAQAFEYFTHAMDVGDPFDLVILDLTIQGGLGGKATMEAIRQLDQNVRAIVSSGYSDNPVMAEYKKYGFNAVVKKPFQVDELSQIIHNLVQKQ